jgi:hypothetical protein
VYRGDAGAVRLRRAAARRRRARSLDVRVAQAADFSRIEFHWTGGAKLVSNRDGQTLVLRFSRDANPDLSPP